MDEIFHGTALLNIFIIPAIIISTILAFFKGIFLREKNNLPDKVNTTCPICSSSNFSYLTQKEKRETKIYEHTIINIIFSIVILITTILILIISIIDSDSFEILEYILNITKIESINFSAFELIVNINSIKIHAILTIINTFILKIWGRKKENIIISICNQCGNINSYPNE